MVPIVGRRSVLRGVVLVGGVGVAASVDEGDGCDCGDIVVRGGDGCVRVVDVDGAIASCRIACVGGLWQRVWCDWRVAVVGAVAVSCDITAVVVVVVVVLWCECV